MEYIPIELIIEIFEDMYNINQYRRINKKINNIIEYLFNSNINIYNETFPGWINNKNKLIKLLLKYHKYKALDFFIRNFKFNITKLLQYAAFYGEDKYLRIKTSNEASYAAYGAIKGDNVSLFKNIIEKYPGFKNNNIIFDKILDKLKNLKDISLIKYLYTNKIINGKQLLYVMQELNLKT